MRHYKTYAAQFTNTVRIDIQEDLLGRNDTIKIEDQKIDGVVGFKWSITCQTWANRRVYGKRAESVIVIDVWGYDPYSFGNVQYGVRVQNAPAIDVYDKHINKSFYIPHDELYDTRGAIKKGQIVILVDATYYMPARVKEQNDRYLSQAAETVNRDVRLNVFELINGTDQAMDLEIVVGDGKIKGHKAFLSLVSPVFNAMFTHNTQEAQSGVVTIKDFDYATVKEAIDMLYGNPFKPISVGRAIYLLKFAEKYIIKVAVDNLETWISDKITTDAFALVVRHAWEHSSEKLKFACGKFYHQNFEIGSRNDFKQLEENVVKELANYASR
uniref:BTB domain-containing protein n=1 Tax=Panagrellus redivivus TaxID=6233 RepID=A0A7E4W231_PANRE